LTLWSISYDLEEEVVAQDRALDLHLLEKPIQAELQLLFIYTSINEGPYDRV
jgi:hypothetical protein